MDNSKDKELDSYGVWVKRNVDNEESIDLTLDDDTFADLPDLDDSNIFEDSDFSDMFKDNDVFNTDKNKFFDDNDSTLTNDELANITNGVQAEEIELDNTIEDSTDSLTIDDDIQFDDNAIDMNFDAFSDTEISSEDLNIETSEVVDMNFDDSTDIFTEEFTDFNIEETVPETTQPIEVSATTETETEETEISLDSFEEEISLDDFMDEGFSDDSVAAGNNGYEPGKEPKAVSSSETEEISLDDFVDFMEETPKETQAEEIIDEKPLDMEINFDDSVDSVETEENSSVISSDIDDDFDFEETTESVESFEVAESFESNIPTTEVSMDDFESEEIDLSDFGIDANAEETAVTQDVEASKAKETLVDYDLSVGEEENLSSAPIVNEIKDKKEDESSQPEQIVQQPTVPEGSTVVETSLLQQIVADLSSLKNEINSLKKDLSDLSTEKTISQPEVSEDIEIPEDTTSSGGFFDTDDTDDTIALSGDELENIMNSADFTEEAQSNFETTETTPSEVPTEKEFDSETVVVPEEPQIEETSVDIEDEINDFDIEEENENAIVETETSDVNVPAIEDEIQATENIIDENEIINEDDTISEDSIFQISSETENENDSIEIENITDENITEETFEENEIIYSDEVENNAEETIETEVIEEKQEEPSAEENITDDFDNSFALPDGIELSNDDATEEVILSSDSEEDVPVEESVTEEVVEEESIETAITVEPTDEIIEDTFVKEEFNNEEVEETTIEEDLVVEPQETSLSETIIEDSTEDDFSMDDDLDFTFNDNLDDTDDSLPEEISIPTEDSNNLEIDDIFVESSETDFIDDSISSDEDFNSLNVDETADEIIEDSTIEASFEDITEEANLEDETLEISNIIEETVDIPSEETAIDEINIEESVEEEISDEVVIDAPIETSFEDNEEQITIEETTPTFEDEITETNDSDSLNTSFKDEIEQISTEEIETDDSTEIDADIPTVSDIVENANKPVEENTVVESSFETTVAPTSTPSVPTGSSGSGTDLRSEIKSVLLYMDQLLENLPEEKIMEFAKSEEFTTYKKLFSELGLS